MFSTSYFKSSLSTISIKRVPWVRDFECVRLKFSGRGAGLVTPSKPPPSYEQLLPLPTPCFKMFLERSLNDLPPPLQASFTATPRAQPPPLPPIKILIIHSSRERRERGKKILSSSLFLPAQCFSHPLRRLSQGYFSLIDF